MGVQRCLPREKVSAHWDQQAPSKTLAVRMASSRDRRQRPRPTPLRGGGKGPEAESGEAGAEGRAADPTRGGDLRVCAGVALRRLPRRLGVDAGDDMALGVPARQTRGHAAPASGGSAAAQTTSQRSAGFPEGGRCSRRTRVPAALGGLRSEGRAPTPHEPGTRFPAGRAVVTAVTAFGGAPPITAALPPGSASERRHCAPTGGTELRARRLAEGGRGPRAVPPLLSDGLTQSRAAVSREIRESPQALSTLGLVCARSLAMEKVLYRLSLSLAMKDTPNAFALFIRG